MKHALLALLLTLAAAAAFAETPETVAITYRVSKANEAKLLDVIHGHWSTLTSKNLVTGSRQLFRGDGFFLEIFTWKDASIPDNAPAEVLKWWGEMNKLVEKGGLRIDEIHAVEMKE